MQFKLVQRLPTAYGWVTSRPIDERVMRSYTDPIRQNAGVRRDLRRLLLAVDTRYTFEAAESLRGFDKPALVLWADGDKIFPREHGKRLAELLPQGRFELVPDSRTFIPEEQPEFLASRLREFLAGASARDRSHQPSAQEEGEAGEHQRSEREAGEGEAATTDRGSSGLDHR